MLRLIGPSSQRHKRGCPSGGTCAGAILLAKDIVSSRQTTFGLMDISIRRNDYGGQIGEFWKLCFLLQSGIFPASSSVHQSSRTCHPTLRGLLFEGNPVLVKQGNLLASTFHPELTSFNHNHRYFVESVKNFLVSQPLNPLPPSNSWPQLPLTTPLSSVCGRMLSRVGFLR